MKIAILDDYQNVASSLADWDSLAAEVVVFTKAFADGDEAVRSLAGFDVLVAMRERTRFPAEVLERLTGLRLLVSTGPANAAIDVAAARRHGITVCGTGYESHPTIEHTWALILGAQETCPPRRSRCAAAAGRSRSARGCTARPSACWAWAGSAPEWRGSDGHSG
ncbi:MAG TPA: hypothetical protein VN961_07190 [Streptosporangiaceae bacterium]|nr:hypothetical protein [Streptosporangiaceae bacterium]